VRTLHRVLEFKQSRWLEPYVNFNTEKRKVAPNPFKVDEQQHFWEGNGESVEETGRALMTNPASAKRFVARPTFSLFHIVNESLTIIKMGKIQVY